MKQDENTRISMGALKALMNARIAPVLVGPPGVGKTATIYQIARDMGYELLVIIGSRLEATDISGLPKAVLVSPEDENGEAVYATEYVATKWQHIVMTRKKVMVFFDEWSNTPNSVRASMLTVLQDREFPNGQKMPHETILVAAMNPSSQAADGYELDMPTTNRMAFLHWNPSVSAWCEGMNTAWGKNVSPEELAWKQKIARFITTNPSYLHKEPDALSNLDVYGLNVNDPSAMEVARCAWASRRSWDNVSRALPHAGNDVIIQDTIIQGLVGFSASAEFRDWLRKNDKIDPNEVIENPEIVEWQNMSVDDANMLMRNIDKLMDGDNIRKVIHVYDVIADQGRTDLAGSYIAQLFKRVSEVSKESDLAENKRLLRDVIAPKYQGIGRSKR